MGSLMPTESKRLLIANNVETTLRGIRKADGYWYSATPESVTQERKSLDQIKSAVMPYAQIELDDQDNEFLYASKRDRGVYEIVIFGIVKADPSLQQRDRERWIQDIHIALQVDTTRGQNARWTRIAEVSISDGQLGLTQHSAFRMRLEITFDFDWSQP